MALTFTEGLLMPPWMEDTPLSNVWQEAYIETGDAALAMEAVRRSDQYDQYFAGNRREDGTLRYDENVYQSIIESYEDTLLSVNVNPDLFRDEIIGMMEGETSPNEFTTRVESAYENVVIAAPEIRNYYSTNYGIELTDEAVVASFLSPRVGEAILDRRIAVSEVGGTAAQRGFTLGRQFAESLVQAGVTEAGSQQLFGAAAEVVPTMNVLAQRHFDPDDDFDVYEFSQAMVFDDPTQRRRMRRLVAQERALFGPSLVPSFGVGQFNVGRLGGITGLNPS